MAAISLPDSFIDCSATDHPQGRKLYRLYQELLQKPEAAVLRDNPPKLYYMSRGEAFDMTNAFAVQMSREEFILIGGAQTQILTPAEQKAVLAHELGHRILHRTGNAVTGFWAKRNEKNERRADKIAAALIDYEVEPLISAFTKIRAKAQEINALIARCGDCEAWDDEEIDTEPSASTGRGLLSRAANAVFCALGTVAMVGVKTWYAMSDRSHPRDASRNYSLRKLAAEHGVGVTVSEGRSL